MVSLILLMILRGPEGFLSHPGLSHGGLSQGGLSQGLAAGGAAVVAGGLAAARVALAGAVELSATMADTQMTSRTTKIASNFISRETSEC